MCVSPAGICHLLDERDRKEFGTCYRHDWYFGHDKCEGGQTKNTAILYPYNDRTTKKCILVGSSGISETSIYECPVIA